MTTVAVCQDCGDEHHVGERSFEEVTTTCPTCGAQSYATKCNGASITKSDAERIESVIDGVDGVGQQTKANILSHFDYYPSFEVASVEELTAIDNVGEQTARNIRRAVDQNS